MRPERKHQELDNLDTFPASQHLLRNLHALVKNLSPDIVDLDLGFAESTVLASNNPGIKYELLRERGCSHIDKDLLDPEGKIIITHSYDLYEIPDGFSIERRDLIPIPFIPPGAETTQDLLDYFNEESKKSDEAADQERQLGLTLVGENEVRELLYALLKARLIK